MCACPQKENGHIEIANDLWETLCRTDISGTQIRVFDSILRKTWGWSKKEDAIPISQISKMTNLSSRTVIRSIQELEAKMMLFVIRKKTDGKNEANVYRINKDYDIWVVTNSAPQVEKNRNKAKIRSDKLRHGVGGSDKLGKLVVTNSASDMKSLSHSIDTLSKDTIKRKGSASLKPYIEGDRAWQDPNDPNHWRVQIHSGQWVDYSGNVKANLEWK